MSAPSITIFGLGAATAVGRDIDSTAAAIRAGISGYSLHRFMTDAVGVPLRVAAAPWLDPALPALSRLEELLFPVIDETLADAKLNGVRLALALGLPDSRPGMPADFSKWRGESLASAYKRRFTGIACVESGHAASLLALEAAIASIHRDKFDACVVAGVDSYLPPATLEWLERNDQLQGAGPQNNAWGFVPGEAAAAVLVARTDLGPTLDLPGCGRVLAIASGEETNRIKTRTVCTGRGLGDVLARVLAAMPTGRKVDDLYNDMNGEPYRADEFGFAISRLSPSFRHASDMKTPADCSGDVGAASGVLHIALAAIAARKRYAAGPLTVVHAGSENGARAAALLGFANAE